MIFTHQSYVEATLQVYSRSYVACSQATPRFYLAAAVERDKILEWPGNKARLRVYVRTMSLVIMECITTKREARATVNEGHKYALNWCGLQWVSLFSSA